VLGGCAVTPQPSRLTLEEFRTLQAPGLVDLVRVLETTSNRERRTILKAVLDDRAIAYRAEAYSLDGARGENLVFEVGQGPRTVIVTAHHDVHPGSPGANDDASCIASILAAHERLRRDPPRGLRVRFIIFDGEERTREGSRAYVRSRDLSDVIGVYSYELCGIGRRVNVWDVVRPELTETEIFRALVAALEEARRPYVVRGRVGPASSDHESFMKLDPPVPGFGVTILPDGGLAQLRPFRHYHGPTDRASTLEEQAMWAMADLIMLTVRRLEGR
jgi:hypothetical protein